MIVADCSTFILLCANNLCEQVVVRVVVERGDGPFWPYNAS